MELTELLTKYPWLQELTKSRKLLRILELAGKKRGTKAIARDTMLPEEDVKKALDVLTRLGLIKREGSRFAFTELGRTFLEAMEKEY